MNWIDFVPKCIEDVNLGKFLQADFKVLC